MTKEQIDIKTPEFVSLQFKLAGLGSRAAAMILDQVILTILNIIAIVLLLFITSSDIMLMAEPGWLFAVFIIVLFVVNWGYFFVCEFFFGGKTIGKHMVGIRVIQENGHSVTFLSAIIRNLLRIVDMLPTSYFLGIVLIFFHSKHKRLGDMAAGTIVVHERQVKRQSKSAIEKEIDRRGLSKDTLQVEEWVIRSLGEKDWKLLKTYTQKFPTLQDYRKVQLTKEIASILLSKIGLEAGTKTNQELENILLVLYLYMKEEWEYEL
ncbi:RDD family protein [Ornithinibacillus sp. L9]|uniref:RDD family protein n=1 Tax=Ornithinibacillus caprae TaxID=2678566 RepID=A0A6N8FGB0_9BACI|nr:RDD family protein [Ornithinibacillus caprae]MUK88702.1 RDD family protein [Ornithinibacillus caprae]